MGSSLPRRADEFTDVDRSASAGARWSLFTRACVRNLCASVFGREMCVVERARSHVEAKMKRERNEWIRGREEWKLKHLS